ncbi:hypothetical protein IIM_01541 [Bacillus cereus VD107]|nr:hypothetical protein IIM_01541 [Bacillus cereus VD107]
MNIVSMQRDEELIENMVNLYCIVFERTNFEEMKERINRHMDYPNFKGIVALNDEGAVIGFSYGYQSLNGQYYNQLMREVLNFEKVDQWLEDCFEFVELAVHPKYRNVGLGTKLHNGLLEGIPNRTSVLTTQINNLKARSLYEKLDWVNVLEPFHPSKDNAPYVLMGKAIKTKVN